MAGLSPSLTPDGKGGTPATVLARFSIESAITTGVVQPFNLFSGYVSAALSIAIHARSVDRSYLQKPLLSITKI